MSEEQAQKCHSDDVPLPKSGWCLRLVENLLQPIRSTSKWDLSSHHVISMEPLMASQNVSCSFRVGKQWITKFFPLSFPWWWKCMQPCRIMPYIMVWTVLVLHVQRKLKTTYRIQVLSEWHILIPKQEVQQSTWNKWGNKWWKFLKIKITKNIVLRKFCEHSISQRTIVSPKGNKKQCTYPTFVGITICIMRNMKVANCLMTKKWTVII